MFSAGIGIEQMARMLTSENATQRGSTAAAALDAIAAVSRVLSYDLLRYGVMVVEKSATLPRMALESISGKLQQGDGRVGGCLTDVLPAGTFTQPEFMTALGIPRTAVNAATAAVDGPHPQLHRSPAARRT